MKVNVSDKAMVFRKEYPSKSGGDPFIKYSVSLPKKLQSGEWDNGWLFARFRKGVELSNKTQILIKEGWLTFDKYEKEGKQITEWGVFINEFDILEGDIQGFAALQDEDIPF